MLSRRAKATFYAAAGPLMRVNAILYKAFRAPRSGELRVHLGPGQKNYIDGWINVDANVFTGKADVWADLRNPLPFHDDTVAAMYSHHVIEHLPDMADHLRDVLRCLKPGGIYRVGGPNGDSAIKKFVEGDASWFGGFPDDRRSIGGRLENFIFCRQEHLTILTASFMSELLTDAGFTSITEHEPIRSSDEPELFKGCLDGRRIGHRIRPHTLILEARKPAA